MNENNPPVIGSTTCPPANFNCGMARVTDPPPPSREFKAEFIRTAMFTELAAIQLTLDDIQLDPHFGYIKAALSALTTDQILNKTEQLERTL